MIEATTWEHIANLIVSVLEHLYLPISKLRDIHITVQLICLVNVMI